MRHGRGPVLAALVLAATAAGCAPMTGGPGGSAGYGPPEELPPAGHGSLRQEEITLSLRSGDLQIKVTPLEEWMIRLAAPDTYRRLSDLASGHRPALERESGLEAPTLFLVSYFSDEPNVPFEPEDLHLLDRGRRFRPVAMRPLSGSFGSRRLAQRETRMAVYAFGPGVRLDMGLVVEYGDVRNTQWDAILQGLQSELALVRARGYEPTSSRPKRLIFR